MIAVQCESAEADSETPQKQFVANARHRFFTEEIPYGLLVSKGVATLADNVQTPSKK